MNHHRTLTQVRMFYYTVSFILISLMVCIIDSWFSPSCIVFVDLVHYFRHAMITCSSDEGVIN
jgi:hypothetical protein